MKTVERFILVDDNEADNVYHEIMIRKAGFAGEVLVFETGVDALAFLQTDTLDQATCIFLDINMPMLDGFEVAERATPMIAGKPTVLLVMLTSSGSPLDRQRADEMPVIRGYVTKPLAMAMVQKLLATGI